MKADKIIFPLLDLIPVMFTLTSCLLLTGMNKWKKNIVEEIAMVDFAFIDGTFYDEEEINYRDISEIPHPFIIESIQLLKKLSPKEKNKVYFIHLNHTNPALDEGSEAYQAIMESGFHVAKLNEVFPL